MSRILLVSSFDLLIEERNILRAAKHTVRTVEELSLKECQRWPAGKLITAKHPRLPGKDHAEFGEMRDVLVKIKEAYSALLIGVIGIFNEEEEELLRQIKAQPIMPLNKAQLLKFCK